MLIEEILSSIAFVRDWTSTGLQNVWLLLLVNISRRPPSSTALGFQHFSLMSTSLSKSSKFPMLSPSIRSSSSSTINFFSEGLSFSNNPKKARLGGGQFLNPLLRVVFPKICFRERERRERERERERERKRERQRERQRQRDRETERDREREREKEIER